LIFFFFLINFLIRFFSKNKDSKGRTLLLDLDETLIHSCGIKDNPDYIVVARGEYGDENKVKSLKNLSYNN
jgi:hypothetical protein